MIRFARILALALVALTLTARVAAAVCCVDGSSCTGYTSCSSGVDGSCLSGSVQCGDVCSGNVCQYFGNPTEVPGLSAIGTIAASVLLLSLGSALLWRRRHHHGG